MRKIADKIIAILWKKKKIIKDEKIVTKSQDELMKQFEEETGKHAIWGGKTTKQFLKWNEKNE